MNWRGRPELRERLAAEYALGTLRGRARLRFRRWMREDALAARAAGEWEARLAPLAAAVRPVAPPARVWAGIRERLDAGARGGLWDSVRFWRALGLLAGGMAAALLVATVAFRPAPAPTDAFLAVLADPKTQAPRMVVSADRQGRALRLRVLDASMRAPGKDLELWALPADGPPRSLGVAARATRATLPIARPVEQALGDVPALALSLEPEGGSPTGAPTGPVLAIGPWVKVW